MSSPQLNRFNQAALNLSETGQNNIRVLRGWAKSKGWTKFSDPRIGGPEKWGTFKIDEGKYQWNLLIKPEASFRPGLKPNSNFPRFDARLDVGRYINPFTGEIGTRSTISHVLLDKTY